MANSRLEKIGTIYTRTRGLIESGAMNWIDRPLWYDLYEAFPPKEEPRFDRPAVTKPLRKIFYKDDIFRALFHNNNKRVGTVNLSNSQTKSLTQEFIETCKKLDAQYEGKATEEKLYVEAIDLLKSQREMKKEQDEFVGLTAAYKDSLGKDKNLSSTDTKSNINLKEIFKS